MTPEAFCYWLQGALELGDMKEMSPEEVKIIKDHLKLVFDKLTPTYGLNTAPITMPPALRPFLEGVGGAQQAPYTVRDNTGSYLPPNGVTISC